MRIIQNHRKASIEVTLTEIGFGAAQIEITVVVALILVASLNLNIGISFIVPAAVCDLNLTSADKGLLSGMVPLGMVVSSFFMGYFADTKGRRKVILITLLSSIIFSIISTFTANFIYFLLCRLLIGIFMAGYAPTIYTYVGEFNTDKNRGAIISLISTGVGFAAIIQPLLAWWILSYEWSYELYDGYLFKPWRLLMIVYMLPGIVAFLWLLLRLPESPKYYIATRQKQESLRVMQWIYRTNRRVESYENFNVHEIEAERTEATTDQSQTGLKAILSSLISQTVPLFKPPYLLYFFVCSFLQFGTFAVGTGLGLFLPDVLNQIAKANGGQSGGGELKICEALQAHHNSTNNSTIPTKCDDSVDESVFINSALLGVAYLIAFVIISTTIKALGRKKLFLITLLVSGISGLVLTWITSKYLILILFCLFILLAGIHVSTINSATCDLFPTYLRAMAVCVTMMFGRVGSTASTNFIGFMLEDNCEWMFHIYAALMFICMFMSLILPDSKRREGYDEIE